MICNCGKPAAWASNMCKSCQQIFSDLQNDEFIENPIHVLWVYQILARQDLEEFYKQRSKLVKILFLILFLSAISFGVVLVWQILTNRIL